MARRAPGRAPRRAPGAHPDAQDVRQLRGHVRRRRGPLHRRRAARAEPAQEERLRQRGRRRLRRRRHHIRLQRKEHPFCAHSWFLPGFYICCAGRWRQHYQSGQWQRVLSLHSRE
uniref:Uncharacterized protein n=2 Tax=Oryza TaxID=4527 RepID=A0A0E0NK52_ORYRU